MACRTGFLPQFLANLFRALGLLFIVSCSDSPTSIFSPEPDKFAAENKQIATLYNPQKAEKQYCQLDSIFKQLHNKRGFNGTVLVTQFNKIIYKGAFGYADFGKKDTLTTQKPFQLASVTKQFTAMAIMMLQEKGQLKYEDEVQVFFPDFPYDCITVKQLLQHRSGLPNYMYFTEKYWPDRRVFMNNEQVVKLLIAYKPTIYFRPDVRFNYSNTGYCLLAAIVAKVSGMPFEKYVQEHIFKPLHMKDSWVLTNNSSDLPPGHTARRRKREIDFLDGVQGDKGIYSTVEDLYKWDQALYSEKLVKKSTLIEAFSGSGKSTSKEDYGFGWRLRKLANGEPVEYHGGLWHGFNSYIMRNRKDHSAIIVLSNVPNGSLRQLEGVHQVLYPTSTPEVIAQKNMVKPKF